MLCRDPWRGVQHAGLLPGLIYRLQRFRVKYLVNKAALAELQERARELDETHGGLGVADDEIDMCANPIVIQMAALSKQLEEVNVRLDTRAERDEQFMQWLEMEREKLQASTSHALDSATSASPNELTEAELKTVTKGSLAYLHSREPALYMHHLVTAMLCLGLAPRSQVLRQLQLGSTFVKEADGRYWVRMLADHNKNGKPTAFALARELTEPYDFYLSTIRPALLQQQHHQGEGNQLHDYVFFKRNGSAPRADFSELTALATQQLIGRPVNAHAFRSAVITTFYKSGASQSDMDVLASLMAHDPATARTYYFRPQMAEAAVSTNERVLASLLGDS